LVAFFVCAEAVFDAFVIFCHQGLRIRRSLRSGSTGCFSKAIADIPENWQPANSSRAAPVAKN